MAIASCVPLQTRLSAAVAAAPRGCTGGSLYVAAHADDPLLFMLPDLDRDIAAGRCVEVVLLTTGDANQPQRYWESREAGLAKALALLAGRPDRWRERSVGLPGHPAVLATLQENTRLSMVFMRLPDGRSDGSGFAGRGSMKLLWENAIPTLTSVDVSPPSAMYSPSIYTRADLIRALRFLVVRAQPARIGVQDYVGSLDARTDHADHRAGAQFALAAAWAYRGRATLVGYLDYEILRLPPNVSGVDVARKQEAWFAYLSYDSQLAGVCQTVDSCLSPGNYGNYWSREYPIEPAIRLNVQP